MNKMRRNRIKKAIELLDEANEILSEVVDDEQMAYDNLPESIQGSENGEKMCENIEELEEAMDGLDDVKSVLEDL